MDVIHHSTDTIRFAPSVPRPRRKIGMETGPRRFFKMRVPILRAEDNVDDDEAEGLGHA
jgi:hypothetical protein